MFKDLENKLQFHRKANITTSFRSEHRKLENKLISKHPRYLYHKSYYLSMTTPIKVLCRSHGFFYATPAELLKSSHTCSKCAKSQKYKDIWIYKNKKYCTKSFISECERINGHKYQYDQTIFRGFHLPIYFFCKEHRYVKSKPHLHLSDKFICPRCRGSIRKTK